MLRRPRVSARVHIDGGAATAAAQAPELRPAIGPTVCRAEAHLPKRPEVGVVVDQPRPTEPQVRGSDPLGRALPAEFVAGYRPAGSLN